MEINEIKKELYKQKPKANLINVTKSGLLYSTTYKMDISCNRVRWVPVKFLVPLSEIGDATFGPTGVEAQLLIRYIIPQTDTQTIDTQ